MHRSIGLSTSSSLSSLLHITGLLCPPIKPTTSAVYTSLSILHPRPTAVILGGGYDDAVAKEVGEAWKLYRAEREKEGEGWKGFYLRVDKKWWEMGKKGMEDKVKEEVRKGLLGKS